MIEYEGQTLATSREAASILGKTMTAFRQFMVRNKLERRKLGGRLYFDVSYLNTYYTKTKGIESFEDTDYDTGEMVSWPELHRILPVSKQHLYALARKGVLERYITREGVILCTKRSIEKFLGANENAAADL